MLYIRVDLTKKTKIMSVANEFYTDGIHMLVRAIYRVRYQLKNRPSEVYKFSYDSIDHFHIILATKITDNKYITLLGRV